MLEIKGLKYGYDLDKPVIKNLDLKVEANSCNALLGQNGSGKSTLGKILAQIVRPEAGEITLNGKPLTTNSIAIVFQNPDHQFVRPGVFDDLAFGLENINLPIDEIALKINEIAKYFEITHLLERNINDLSGGEKQRVAIVSSLLLNHDVLILDEATDMLDPTTRDMTLKKLFTYCAEQQITLIFITHDMELAFAMDNIILMAEGTVIANAAPNVIFHNRKLVEENRLTIPFSVKIIEEICGDFCFVDLVDFKEQYEFKNK